MAAAGRKLTTTVAELETKMNCGQAEELVIQADNELQLARKLLALKPWEPLIADPPPNQWKWPPYLMSVRPYITVRLGCQATVVKYKHHNSALPLDTLPVTQLETSPGHLV
ncbi:hypothetical protein LSTR_LSTR000582 [Laodelphax striatellus]|uniref:NADH dehydrogenase [ubiquinone] 1 alpha subcomplex subunit 5 n=1 Tax=Laodelphax striatellus TaxID=195883 RepID=A0A482XGF9_LAOST|nr:hypothetical protein LSTR_LSTR000582 [Laodelphax striatellus]